MWNHKTITGFTLAVSWLLSLAAQPVYASINGIWSSDTDYYLLLQDTASTQVVGLRIAQTLDSGEVFLGTLASDNTLSMSGFKGTATISATVSSTSISGTLAHDGASTAFTAALLLAYNGSAYDGIWQTNQNHYLVYLSVTAKNTGSTAASTVTVVVDVLVKEDGTPVIEVFAGALVSTKYTGVSLTNTAKTLGLTFNSDGKNADGKYTTVTSTSTRPVSESFTAALIFDV